MNLSFVSELNQCKVAKRSEAMLWATRANLVFQCFCTMEVFLFSKSIIPVAFGTNFRVDCDSAIKTPFKAILTKSIVFLETRNTQKIVTIKADCDGDALLVLVNPQGPACHTGAQSCFYQSIFSETSSGNSQLPQFSKTVDQLVKTIKNRKQHKPEGSYTSYLFTHGRDKILKKIGEESAETIIAAKNLSKRELTSESADLFYHLLVLLINEGVEIGEVIAELDRRAKKRSPEK